MPGNCHVPVPDNYNEQLWQATIAISGVPSMTTKWRQAEPQIEGASAQIKPLF